MNIYKTLLFVLGFAVIATNGFAENRHSSALEKQTQDAKQTADENNQQQGQTQIAVNQPLIYVPPMRGAPANSRLVGGGTRALGADYPSLAVLAPSHTGLTSQAQPILYWHISKAVEEPLQFVLVSDRSVKPILNIELDTPITVGVQKLSLSEYGVSLETGAEYQWSIALVPNPDMRSYDIVTSGKIKRIERDKMLQNRLAGSADNLHASMLAKSGLWYDAIEAVSKQIEANPGDQTVKESRAQLFDQVGLIKVAKDERSALRNPAKTNIASP